VVSQPRITLSLRVEIHPLTFSDFVSICKYVVIFTLGPPQTLEHRSHHSLYMKLCGPHNRLGRRNKEHISTPPSIEPRFSCNPGVSLNFTDVLPALQVHALQKRIRSYGWNDGFCFSSCVVAINRKVKTGERFITPYRNVFMCIT